jgi:hypothetical protein
MRAEGVAGGVREPIDVRWAETAGSSDMGILLIVKLNSATELPVTLK